MKKLILTAALLGALVASRPAEACTNILVTRGASTDGSTMITYAADSHTLYGELYYQPARDYAPGTMLKIYEWDTGKYLGEIPQVAHTYQTVGNMNEHQLMIAETTYGGRPELVDTTGIMDYGSMIYITLQRARTAREAITVMTSLANEYGYASSGESISIADANEVWILEMIGKGTRLVDGKNVNKGIVWVAVRVPDGYISAHANQARIMQFPLNDPENCLYAPDVIAFARANGLYDGKDRDFSFSDTYAPLDFSGMRGCEARVWSVFRKVTPGMDRYENYALGHNPKNRMPLWVKPAEKISPKQVMDFMRDHYEGTPMDMRNDIGAGGHGLPYRWRPMNFEVDGTTYLNERAIATQQTGFWFVAQGRNWLPDPIGGILWFGVDDAGTSCLTPIYCSVDRVPPCFEEGNGSLGEYSSSSAFWIFNRVTNFAYLRYDRMSADILRVVDEHENRCLREVRAVDQTALNLYQDDPKLATEYLTGYSVGTAQAMFDRWVELDRYLLVKYMDGNVKKEENGRFKDNGNDPRMLAMPDFPGYNETWQKAVAGSTGDRLKSAE
ncbi:MAG: C69 family dipeptidase [Rikenellaceae bacterium]|nr:C69 family dipeptidase [Rikenellaceae bacterium]